MTGQFVWKLPKTGGQPTVITMGLDETDVFQIHQGIALAGGNVYMSSRGTTVSSGLGCCSCGWVLGVPESSSIATPSILWAGKGLPAAITASSSFVVVTDLDNKEILVLSP